MRIILYHVKIGGWFIFHFAAKDELEFAKWNEYRIKNENKVHFYTNKTKYIYWTF